jgi:hypothetical protein
MLGWDAVAPDTPNDEPIPTGTGKRIPPGRIAQNHCQSAI